MIKRFRQYQQYAEVIVHLETHMKNMLSQCEPTWWLRRVALHNRSISVKTDTPAMNKDWLHHLISQSRNKYMTPLLDILSKHIKRKGQQPKKVGDIDVNIDTIFSANRSDSNHSGLANVSHEAFSQPFSNVMHPGLTDPQYMAAAMLNDVRATNGTCVAANTHDSNHRSAGSGFADNLQTNTHADSTIDRERIGHEGSHAANACAITTVDDLTDANIANNNSSVPKANEISKLGEPTPKQGVTTEHSTNKTTTTEHHNQSDLTQKAKGNECNKNSDSTQKEKSKEDKKKRELGGNSDGDGGSIYCSKTNHANNSSLTTAEDNSKSGEQTPPQVVTTESPLCNQQHYGRNL